MQKPCGRSGWYKYQGLEKASVARAGRVRRSVVLAESRRRAGPGCARPHRPQAAFLAFPAYVEGTVVGYLACGVGVVGEEMCLDLLCGQGLREAKMGSIHRLCSRPCENDDVLGEEGSKGGKEKPLGSTVD